MSSQNVVKLDYNPYISCTAPPLEIDADHERHRILSLIQEIDNTRGAMLRSAISKARRIAGLVEQIQDSVYRLDASGHPEYVPTDIAGLGIHRTTACKPIFTQIEVDALRSVDFKFHHEPPHVKGY